MFLEMPHVNGITALLDKSPSGTDVMQSTIRTIYVLQLKLEKAPLSLKRTVLFPSPPPNTMFKLMRNLHILHVVKVSCPSVAIESVITVIDANVAVTLLEQRPEKIFRL